MNKRFFVTENYRKLEVAVDALVNRDPSLPGLGLVFGKWGYGKSTAVEYYYSVSDVFYISVQRLWRPRRLLEEICELLNLGDPEYRLDRLSDQVCAGLQRWNKPLFIDEADYLLKNGTMLDVLRDIHDKSRVPVILIGMEKLYRSLQRYGQFFSRILPAGIVEFQPVTASETTRIIKEWTGLSIDFEAVELFCQHCEGDYRYIVGYLLSLENACKTNGVSHADVKIVDAVIGRGRPKRAVKNDRNKMKIAGKP
ncbi:MAG: AAA family ATPase [Desulfobacterales bacterium]|nr:AAA family ATPase [Desulfobacterales bacterium]MDD3082767.1 AAA family ATPase [Desulfobacterales bacterium]MDD3951866.1 AAA family ATPase [Desulfobacterales bacterium]